MIDRLLAGLGVLSIAAALAIIWVARTTVTETVYVSGLGATGMPTEDWFRLGLLLIVAGGALIGVAARDIRARARLLRYGTPAVTIWASSSFFLLASQVTCSPGCPLPLQPTFFSLQDLVHISAAVVAFGLAAWAMLQCAAAVNHPVLARLSLVSAIAVAVIAATGGLMSVFNLRRDIGAWLEFIATTIGLGWVAILGVLLVIAPRSRGRVDDPGTGSADADASGAADRAASTVARAVSGAGG